VESSRAGWLSFEVARDRPGRFATKAAGPNRRDTTAGDMTMTYRPALAALLLAPVTALHGVGNGVLWIEAEHYVTQQGSRAERFTMPCASGGACVNHGWGGREGDFLRFRADLPAAFPAVYVMLCYAREPAGDSIVRVSLDGATNQSALLRLPSTGDWGFKADGWKYAAVQLPACAEGAHTLEVRSAADSNNVNFDRASSTVCWYEEIDHQPPRGHGDSADVWAAAETVYLPRQLLLADQAKKTER
jgi:hypothetical protein